MRAMLIATMFVVALLAGCSGKSSPDKDPDVIVTKDTGAIRGVVTNEAIVPLAGVTVLAVGPEGAETTAITDEEGRFTMNQLAPGPYLVTAQKVGYHEGQATALVVAGDASPPVMTIKLLVNEATKPTYQLLTFDGYIECSFTTPAIAAAACSVLADEGLSDDKFITWIGVERVPDFIQHELVWKATQTTGNQFRLAARTATEEQFERDTYEAGISSSVGISPVIIPINATQIATFDIARNGTGLAPSVFAGGMEGSEPCLPFDPDPVPTPVGTVNLPQCLFGTGATLQQKFTLYTILFFGYVPDPEWSFAQTGSVPEPPM